MGGTGRVLFVDDDDVIVLLAAKTLRRLGRAVDTFTDAASAEAAFAAQPDAYELVVSDVRLGERDAFDMCAALLRVRPGIGIILTSGFPRPEDHERARALGLGEVLLKSRVMTRLSEALQRQRT
jgi:CheY-like chemotaxis protein